MAEQKEGKLPVFVKTPKSEAELYPKVCEYVRKEHKGLSIRVIAQGINFNYALGDGPDFMLKVGPQPFTGREHYCLQAYGKAGLPVPRVCHFERWNDDLGAAVLLTEFIPNTGEVTSVKYDQMGALMKRLHDVRAEGVGELDPREGKGISESWTAYLVARANHRRGQIETRYGKTPLDLIGSLDGITADSVLLHGDFHRHNVLQRQGNIVAVIDPHGIVGHPLYDVACTTNSFDDERKTAFIRGYAPDGLSKEEQKVLRLYERANAVGRLAWFCEVLENTEISQERRTWSIERKEQAERALGLK